MVETISFKEILLLTIKTIKFLKILLGRYSTRLII